MRFAIEVVRIVVFAAGELGGWLLDKITGYDAVAEEARIRADIIRQSEGE